MYVLVRELCVYIFVAKVTEVSRLKNQLVSQEKSISSEERRLDTMVGGTQGSQRSYHSVNRELVEAQRNV